jgi:hypothetical protein
MTEIWKSEAFARTTAGAVQGTKNLLSVHRLLDGVGNWLGGDCRTHSASRFNGCQESIAGCARPRGV